jgi:hypothetical protein
VRLSCSLFVLKAWNIRLICAGNIPSEISNHTCASSSGAICRTSSLQVVTNGLSMIAPTGPNISAAGTVNKPSHARVISRTICKAFIRTVKVLQKLLRERTSNFYTGTILCEGFFNSNNRVNCLVPVDGGRKLAYGTDSGIYLSDRWPKDKISIPKRVLDANQVTQIDVLEDYQLLLVLSNKTLTSYSLEALDPNNQNPLAARPKKIQSQVNSFKAGICLGKHMVCSVRTSGLSSIIKMYEPVDNVTEGRKEPAFSKLLQSGQDALKPFKVPNPHPPSCQGSLPLKLRLINPRNSTYPPNLRPFISSAVLSVSVLPAVSKSFPSKRRTSIPFLMQPIPPLTS